MDTIFLLFIAYILTVVGLYSIELIRRLGGDWVELKKETIFVLSFPIGLATFCLLIGCGKHPDMAFILGAIWYIFLIYSVHVIDQNS